MEPRTTDKVSIRSCVQGGKLKSSQRPVLAPRIGCLDFRSSLDQLLCCLAILYITTNSLPEITQLIVSLYLGVGIWVPFAEPSAESLLRLNTRC